MRIRRLSGGLLAVMVLSPAGLLAAPLAPGTSSPASDHLRVWAQISAVNERIVARSPSSYPNFTRIEVDCPSGYLLRSGGAEALGSHSILNGSFPNDSGTGWIAVGHQPGQSSVGLHVFAVCRRVTAYAPRMKVVSRIRDSYPNFTRLEADCPPGYRLVGGGAEALGPNSILNGSFPTDSGSGWLGVAHQPGQSSVGLHVFAVCLKRGPVHLLNTRIPSRRPDAFPAFTRLGRSCPRRSWLIGGGAEALGPDSVLNGTFPAPGGTGWEAVGHQPGSGSEGLHVFAICISRVA